MSTHNLCSEQKYEKYQKFLSENFHFLVGKFSVYMNRHVLIMWVYTICKGLSVSILWVIPVYFRVLLRGIHKMKFSWRNKKIFIWTLLLWGATLRQSEHPA